METDSIKSEMEEMSVSGDELVRANSREKATRIKLLNFIVSMRFHFSTIGMSFLVFFRCLVRTK